MTQTEQFGYWETDSLQVLELPYLGDRLSMIVLLPRQVDGLAALEDDLTTGNLETWIASLRPREVQVFLPRFTLTGQFSLGDTLREMGMVDAFGDADFSGMTGKRDL